MFFERFDSENWSGGGIYWAQTFRPVDYLKLTHHPSFCQLFLGTILAKKITYGFDQITPTT